MMSPFPFVQNVHLYFLFGVTVSTELISAFSLAMGHVSKRESLFKSQYLVASFPFRDPYPVDYSVDLTVSVLVVKVVALESLWS